MRVAAGPVLGVLLLAGCAGPAAFVPPEPPVPLAGRAFEGPGAVAGEVLAQGWWRAFGDPALDRLVEAAVRGNLDLMRAATRVVEARAVLRESLAARRPEVTAGASAERSRSPGVLFGDPVASRYSLSLGFSYEIDLWGRIARMAEASAREAEAAREDLERAYHSLVAEVVRAYVDLRVAREQLGLAEELAANARDRLRVMEGRHRRGLVPAARVYAARQGLAQAEAEAFGYRQAAERAGVRLGLLLGRYPSPDPGVELAGGPLAAPPPVPVGLPSDLLRRRPDVRAALHRLAAADARVGAAEAGRFPRFALTGSAGRASTELGELTLGGNTFWSLLANLTYPLYNAGAVEAGVRKAGARRDRAFLEYGATVLRALGEVEDVLVVEAEQRGRFEALARAIRTSRARLENAELRYRRGLDDLAGAFDAREALLRAEIQGAGVRQALLRNRVALYLALGGEWGHEGGLVGPRQAGRSRR